MLCRKSQAPPASKLATKWLLVVVAVVSVTGLAGAWSVHRGRTPKLALSAEELVSAAASTAATPPASNDASNDSSPSSSMADAGLAPTIPSMPSAQIFGVSADLIPSFHAVNAPVRVSLPGLNRGDTFEALTARIEAERQSCAQGSTEACLKQLNDCDAAAQMDGGLTPGEQEQRIRLSMAISGPNGAEIRAALARGGAGLPPDLAAAAKAAGIGKEGERRAAQAALRGKCQEARGSLPAACEGGSVAACDRLLQDEKPQALLPKACDVGSRSACVELSRTLGLTTLAGEAARLRALELDKCTRPGATCVAHSRTELGETAHATLRAGINQVCVEKGAAACLELERQFELEQRERGQSDAALIAELRGHNCELGNIPSCSALAVMYADGRGVPRDERKALALNERVRAAHSESLKQLEACDAGDCKMLKALVQAKAPQQASWDAMEEAQLAPDLVARKCDAGALSACFALINAFIAGRHPDPRRATEFRRKAAALLDAQCNAGKADSCDAMADLLIELGGVDRTRGFRIMDSSCNGGRLAACLQLATKSEDREQKEGALRRALPLQEAACNAGNASACLWVAYQTHDLRKSDELKAKADALIVRKLQ